MIAMKQILKNTYSRGSKSPCYTPVLGIFL
nr:MAG TPA: hypothetical protein [Caudoviricetes sp.]